MQLIKTQQELIALDLGMQAINFRGAQVEAAQARARIHELEGSGSNATVNSVLSVSQIQAGSIGASGNGSFGGTLSCSGGKVELSLEERGQIQRATDNWRTVSPILMGRARLLLDTASK